VLGSPQVPDAKVRAYLDLEGNPEEGFVYLAGVLSAEGGSETRHSFWADSKDQQPRLFEQLLDLLRPYERAFLKRVRKQATTSRPGPARRGVRYPRLGGRRPTP
jgi:hypothetical protein